LHRPGRTKPIRVTPKRLATSIARLDGAETAANTVIPAAAVFCSSSYDARPLTHTTSSSRGTPASTAQPIALSSALWRPTSSRTATSSPSGVNRPAACSPPVASNSVCAARSVSGSDATVSIDRRGPDGSGGSQRASSASRCAFPHTPQAELITK